MAAPVVAARHEASDLRMSNGDMQRLTGRVAVVTGGGAGKLALDKRNLHRQAVFGTQP